MRGGLCEWLGEEAGLQGGLSKGPSDKQTWPFLDPDGDQVDHLSKILYEGLSDEHAFYLDNDVRSGGKLVMNKPNKILPEMVEKLVFISTLAG